jgi:hypothetical protein
VTPDERPSNESAEPDDEAQDAARPKALIAVVVLVVLALIAGGVWVAVLASGDDEPSGYEDVADTFMETCRETAPARISSPAEFCVCYFEGVQEQLSFEEFVDLDEQVREEGLEMPENIVAIQQDCELETATTTLPPGSTTTTGPAAATTATTVAPG